MPHGRAAGAAQPQISCSFGVPAADLGLAPLGLGWGWALPQPCSPPPILDPSGILGVLSTLGSWSWVTPGAQRCPHVTPHGWPCQRVPQEPFCTSWGFSRNSREEEEGAGASLTQTPFAPHSTLIPKALGLQEEPHPRAFSPGSMPPGDSLWCESRTPLGSFWVLTLLPNFVPLSSLCISGTPLEKAPSPITHGCLCSGFFSRKIHGICLP